MSARTIGKYRILESLDRGGSGTVFKAVDETTGREVALKVLNKDVAEADAMNRFELTAKALAKLDHPGMAAIYEVDRVGDAVVLAMELVRGETLDELLKRVGALPAERAAYLIAQVLAALGPAHAIGVIHRDLKPAKVMITPLGVVKVLDFGIGHVEESVQMTAVAFVETPAYMSPERILGNDVDARADLYTVGVLFYRLLTERVPFDAASPTEMVAKQLAELPAPARTYRPDVPEWCEAILARALAKSPADRFQTADEFRAALIGSINPAASETTGQYKVEASAALGNDEPTAPLSLADRPVGHDGPILLAHVSAVVPQAMAFPEAFPPGQGVLLTPTANQAVVQAAPTMLVPAVIVPTVAVPIEALAPTAVAPMPSAPPGTTLVMERKQFVVAGLVLGALALGVVVLAVIVLRRPVAVVAPADLGQVAVVPPTSTAAPESAGASTPAMALVDPPVRSEPVEGGPPPLAAPVTSAPRKANAPELPSSSPSLPTTAAVARVTNTAPFAFDGKAVVAEGDKRRERDAHVMIADGAMTVTQKGDKVLYVVPVAGLIGLTYSNSKQPLWNSPDGPAEALRVEGGAFGFLKGGGNWIGVRTADSLLFLRVDDDSVSAVIVGLQDRTGLEVARLIEPKE